MHNQPLLADDFSTASRFQTSRKALRYLYELSLRF